jgi:hypothetical protein
LFVAPRAELSQFWLSSSLEGKNAISTCVSFESHLRQLIWIGKLNTAASMLLTSVHGIERSGLSRHSMLTFVTVELLLKVDLSVPGPAQSRHRSLELATAGTTNCNHRRSGKPLSDTEDALQHLFPIIRIHRQFEPRTKSVFSKYGRSRRLFHVFSGSTTSSSGTWLLFKIGDLAATGQ